MQPGAGSKLNGPHLPAEDLRPFALPLRTRLALWVMFGAAMCAAAFLLEHAIAILNENEKAALPAVTTELRRAAPSIAVPLPTQEEPIKVNPLQAPAAPKKEMPPEIAELEVLAALTRDDPTFDARTALAHIQPYTDSSNEAVKNAAAKLLARVLGEHDAKARAHARRVAEGAQERVDAGEFAEAEELLKAGLSALPADVAWTAHGREQLEKQWASVTAARANAKIKAAKEFEAAWRGDDETAKIRAEEWLKHRDPEIKTAIEILRIKIDDEQRTVRVQRQHRETAMRAAWLEFFETFSSAIADGDFEAAQTLCKPAPEALILKGGVAQPVNVLAGCLADLAAIRKLQDMVLDKAKNSKRAVHLVLRKGQVHGTLDGRVKLNGLLSEPRLDGSVQLTGFQQGAWSLDSLAVTGSLRPGEARIDEMILAHEGNSALVTGTAPIHLALYPFEIKQPNREMDLSIDLTKADLSLLPPARFGLEEAVGDLAGSVRLTGTPDEPRLTGEIQVTGGRVRLRDREEVIEALGARPVNTHVADETFASDVCRCTVVVTERGLWSLV